MIYKHETDIEHILRENDFLTTNEKFAPVFREFVEVYRKAKAFDEIIEISEECDNYMDFGDDIDAVIRSYKEDL